MRILIVDHGSCDPPDTRAHRLRAGLVGCRVRAGVCGPSSVSSLAVQPEGMFGIHLHDIAAASRTLLAAVRAGAAEPLLAALAAASPSLLGLVREAARQGIAEAVDLVNPDAIFVLHAGILCDLAIETGVPVAVHVGARDLAMATGPVREIVLAALGSSDAVAADAVETIDALRQEWDDVPIIPDPWAAGPDAARQVLAACEAAVRRRR